MPSIETHIISDTGHLLEFLKESGLAGHTWFRGHNCSSWKLQPQVCRTDTHNEFGLLKSFYQRGGHQVGAPRDDELGHWLSLAQHFGLPTRLLDWSESFLTAVYFAVNSLPLRSRCDDVGRDGVVWLLKPHGLNASFGNLPFNAGVFSEVDEPVAAALFTAFGLPSHYGSIRQHAYLAYSPQLRFMRMAAQKASFTWHRDPRPLEDNSNAPSFLRKVIIPGAIKPDIAEHLMALGVTRSTLFPDFAGLADELKVRGVSTN